MQEAERDLMDQVKDLPKIEVNDIAVEAAPVEEPVVEAPKLSEIEQEQLHKGWLPKEEFLKRGGDPDLWRPAKEFKERGELFDKISSLAKTTKDQQKVIDQLYKQQQLVIEQSKAERERILREKITSAAEIGDVETVKTVTDDLVKLKAEDVKPVQQDVQNEMPAEVSNFVERHKSWFGAQGAENRAMTTYAVELDNELQRTRPDMSIADRVALVETDIKKKFSHRFENVMQSKPAPVLSQEPMSSTKVDTIDNLPKEFRDQYHMFKKMYGDKFDKKAFIENVKFMTGGR